MNRAFPLAAALFLATAGASLPPAKPDEAAAAPDPRNPAGPFDPPSQSIPQPAAGVPQPPRAPANEGTGRPVASKSDPDLARGLTAALFDDPSAPAIQGLSISVAGGRATLRGVARSQREKDIATAKAGAVAGLRNVDNEITVSP